MIQLLIAILLGLACPADTNHVQNNSELSTNSTGEGTGGGSQGGNTGQLPPPPIVGG